MENNNISFNTHIGACIYDYEKMKTKEILKAGEIAKKVKIYAKELIKKDMPLLEIAEKIENKIIELGGKPAFPTNLSIDEIAAHYTPFHDDKTLAKGLLKIDLGVQIDGWLSDTAFSMDLDNSNENKKLIEASKQALKKGIDTLKIGITTGEIGKIIENSIESNNLSPIRNLSGHSISNYELHSGITIPNINDDSKTKIKKGLYAIEPFVTNGSGKVREKNPSGIYILMETKNIRNPIAREILKYIIQKYKTLPFCERWLVKKFGTKALFALRQLEKNGNIYQFSQLVEISNSKVAQTEDTILLTEDKKIVTTNDY